MISRQTSISKNIIQFCRFLRNKGFALSIEEEIVALNALQYIDYNNKDIFRLALKSVCCRSKKQLNEFDALFNEYWKESNQAVDAKIKTETKPVLKPSKEETFKSLKSWLNGDRSDEVEETSLYSLHKSLSQKDFSAVPGDEVEELMQIIKAVSKRLAAQVNRRYEKDNRNHLPDLRGTLRKNLRRGGELIEILFRKPKRNRIKLVVICDVSRSMELYANFLLQFMYAFQQVYRRVETFAFSTSLQCITQLLKQTDFHEAMRVLSEQNEGWNGGTRIGKSLDTFVKDHAEKSLDKKTIVIIMSDGWDTGDIDQLKQSMEVIHSKAKKLIWLNPLAGYEHYQPDVAGMKAALTCTDIFAPVHNVDGLRRLVKWL